MKIGIITPTYNRPELLLRLHKTLLVTGSGVDWLHCVVNDGSAANYEAVRGVCERLSGRLIYKRITNSGPLAARNHAIDLALEAGCSHLCFIDDDDYAVNEGLGAIGRKINEFPDNLWFVFKSDKKNCQDNFFWPEDATVLSWFEDIVLNRRLGSDNMIVVAAKLIGGTRFDPKGRNQREWTFFLDLSDKQGQVLVFSDVVRCVEYQENGLTAQTRRVMLTSLEQISNNLERAFRYWIRLPTSINLTFNLIKQILLTPTRLILFYFWRR